MKYSRIFFGDITKLQKRRVIALQNTAFSTSDRNKFDTANFDKSQVAQLDDSLTMVDEQDNVIGPVSKLDGHLKKSTGGARPIAKPHRAFSLFLFNSRNELLLQ